MGASHGFRLVLKEQCVEFRGTCWQIRKQFLVTWSWESLSLYLYSLYIVFFYSSYSPHTTTFAFGSYCLHPRPTDRLSWQPHHGSSRGGTKWRGGRVLAAENGGDLNFIHVSASLLKVVCLWLVVQVSAGAGCMWLLEQGDVYSVQGRGTSASVL